MHPEKKNKYSQKGLPCLKHQRVTIRNHSCEIKDPGCPSISCIIGQTTINRALLDLGASINLLSFFMYQQLGLGDLHPTWVMIQLADRSVKVPKGEITYVLIRVGEFIYPVDFIVPETQPVLNPKAQTPVILG